MGKANLTKLIPFRITAFTWIPILIIYALPVSWWGILLKVFIFFFLCVVIRGTFSPYWNELQFFGAFVTMNSLLFAGILWFGDSIWVVYILSVLIVVGLGTILHQIDKANGNSYKE